MGRLILPSGRLVARDNSVWVMDAKDNEEAFSESVEPGSYLVELAIVHFESTEPGVRPRAAAARVVILDEPVSTWEMALRPGQRLESLGNEEYFGFSVDSGQGCYLDMMTLPFLERLQDSAVQLEESRDEVLEKCYAEIVDPETGSNIILFDCGMGDGSYPTWIGRTDTGRIACFTTDLELLSHSSGPVE